MGDLYGEDFTLWTEQQTTLPRRRAAGELINDTELDWLNPSFATGRSKCNTGKTTGSRGYQAGCARQRTSSARGGTTACFGSLSRLPR